MKTKVIFRQWPNGRIIALFPEIPADIIGRYVESYEHVGQHGGACYQSVMNQTTPAKPAEYAELAEELTRIGYDLEVRLRRSHEMWETMRKEVERLWQFEPLPELSSLNR